MCGNTRVGYRRLIRSYARGTTIIPISVHEGYESQSVRTVVGMTTGSFMLSFNKTVY